MDDHKNFLLKGYQGSVFNYPGLNTAIIRSNFILAHVNIVTAKCEESFLPYSTFANSKDSDQAAQTGAARSQSTLFAEAQKGVYMELRVKKMNK